MSFGGYKGTAPPKLFISFDKEELSDANIGRGKYTDPLKLKEHFVSWDYSFGDITDTGKAKLVLINPATHIEELLFSWYSALSPNGVKNNGWAPINRALLTTKIEARSRFYVRWGYYSPPNHGMITSETNALGLDTALSNLHRFALISMDYEISDNSDKIVTLHFVNTFEMTYGSEEFNQRERAFSVDMVDDKSKARLPSAVIQELLLTLCANDDSIGFAGWSREQEDIVNSDFQSIYAKMLTVEPDNDFVGPPELPPPVDIQPVIPHTVMDAWKSYPAMWDPKNPAAAPFIAINALRDFYQQLGLTTVMNTQSANPTAENAAYASQNQGKGAPSQKSSVVVSEEVKQGRKDNPLNQNSAMTAALTEAMEAPSIETADDILIIDPQRQDYMSIPGVWPPYPLVPVQGTPPMTMVMHQLLHQVKGGAGFITAMTEEQLDRILEQGYFFAAPIPFAKQVVKNKELAEQFLSMENPMTRMAVPAPPTSEGEYGSKQWKFTGPTDFVKILIEEKLMALKAKKEEKQKALKEAADIKNAEAEVARNAEVFYPDVDSGYNALNIMELGDANFRLELHPTHKVSFLSQDLSLDLKTLVRKLNEKYFKSTPMYLQQVRLELNNVPVSKRPIIEKVLAPWKDRGIDWNSSKDVSLQLCVPQSTLASLGAAFKGIKSFPIEAENFENGVSLATGFSKRGDNIITDLSWKEKSGIVFTTLRNSPLTIQKLYSVAKRFETGKYQDEVMSQLRLAFASDSDTLKVVEANRGDGIPTSLGVERKVAMVGDLVFPKVVVDQALSQSVHYAAIGKDIETSEQLNQLNKKELEQLVANDLAYILQSNLLDAFFPALNKEDNGAVLMRWSSYSDELHRDAAKNNKSVPLFRYVAKSPLAVLQKDVPVKVMPHGTSRKLSDLAVPILTQAKMQELNLLKKMVINLNITTLGIPEMDVVFNEITNRKVAVWVHEPRVPGTYHWISGVYAVLSAQHSISVNGYTTKFELFPSSYNDADNMAKFTFVKGGYNTLS